MLDWLACGLANGLSRLLCRLPPWVAVRLGEVLGLLGYWVRPTRTRIGLANLRAAFEGRLTPREARRIIRRCYQQIGAGVLELLRLPVIDLAYVERYVTIEGRRYFDDAVASGHPVILLTGHFGNWEIPSFVAALHGYPITALARAQEKFPRLYRFLVAFRESKGCTIVHKKGGSMKRFVAALDRCEIVGIVGDQASRQGLFVDFFGRPALFARGPFELARRNQAVILRGFMHRVRGPMHRLVIEPPITVSPEGPEEEAVRRGMEQFAEALARHIEEDPSQWLWMHKRWKHTPVRRVLILSDGKLGHLKQSLALLEALRQAAPQVRADTVEIRYRHPLLRSLALLWSLAVPGGRGAATCLTLALTPESAHALLTRSADVLVSCGASLVPVNVLWAAENGAKSIVLMNPAPFPLHRFDLVVAPRHDGLPKRRNVVQTVGALATPLGEDGLRQAKARLRAHPRWKASSSSRRIVAVFIGGHTAHYELPSAFAEALIAQVQAACERCDASYLITTSRRTPPAVERLLAERTGHDPRCRLLLLATRDALDGTMEGMLGSADVAVVTGESISMVSEAGASGRPLVVVEPPLRASSRGDLTKHQRFLRELAAEGAARLVPVPELAFAIQRSLTEPPAAKRLENFAAVREAVARVAGST